MCSTISPSVIATEHGGEASDENFNADDSTTWDYDGVSGLESLQSAVDRRRR